MSFSSHSTSFATALGLTNSFLSMLTYEQTVGWSLVQDASRGTLVVYHVARSEEVTTLVTRDSHYIEGLVAMSIGG